MGKRVRAEREHGRRERAMGERMEELFGARTW
jgi:hypothetical protein